MSGSASTLSCKEQGGPAKPDRSSSGSGRGITKGRVVMDYEMMKALMEANREGLAVQGKSEVKEFPKPDSQPDWKYLDYIRKERMAA